MPQWGPNTILDTAMQLGMKGFVSQKHCQSLMEVWWRGGYPGGTLVLPESFSMLSLWALSCAPSSLRTHLTLNT